MFELKHVIESTTLNSLNCCAVSGAYVVDMDGLHDSLLSICHRSQTPSHCTNINLLFCLYLFIWKLFFPLPLLCLVQPFYDIVGLFVIRGTSGIYDPLEWNDTLGNHFPIGGHHPWATLVPPVCFKWLVPHRHLLSHGGVKETRHVKGCQDVRFFVWKRINEINPPPRCPRNLPIAQQFTKSGAYCAVIRFLHWPGVFFFAFFLGEATSAQARSFSAINEKVSFCN